MLDTSAVTIFDEDEDEDVEDPQETNGSRFFIGTFVRYLTLKYVF